MNSVNELSSFLRDPVVHTNLKAIPPLVKQDLDYTYAKERLDILMKKNPK